MTLPILTLENFRLTRQRRSIWRPPKSSVYGLTLASGHIRAGMVTHADLATLHEARCQYVVARIVQRHLLIGIKARHG